MRLLLLSVATPSATSTDLPRGLQPTDVTPGLAGFLATAFVVVLSILLILNLVSRMRRIRHRGAMEEAREREAAAAAAAAAEHGLGAGQEPAAPVQAQVEGDRHDVVPGEFTSRDDEPGEPDGPDTVRGART